MGSTADSLDQMDSTMGDMDNYQQDLFSVRCPFIAAVVLTQRYTTTPLA